MLDQSRAPQVPCQAQAHVARPQHTHTAQALLAAGDSPHTAVLLCRGTSQTIPVQKFAASDMSNHMPSEQQKQQQQQSGVCTNVDMSPWGSIPVSTLAVCWIP
jgi:hypothetical protein